MVYWETYTAMEVMEVMEQVKMGKRDCPSFPFLLVCGYGL